VCDSQHRYTPTSAVDAQFGDRLIAETEQMQSAVDGCVSQAEEDTYLWPAVCKAVPSSAQDKPGIRMYSANAIARITIAILFVFMITFPLG
jgi:hypothetical protein